MSAPHALTENATWSTIIAAFALLAACAEEPMPLLGSDPNYSMVFFDPGSSSLSKQSRQKLSDDVLTPLAPIKAVLRPDRQRRFASRVIRTILDPKRPTRSSVSVARPSLQSTLST
jgi:hypothetical protein